MKKILIFLFLLVAAFAAGTLVTSRPNSPTAFSHLSPAQFNTALSTGKYTLLDVRTRDEYIAGHLINALQNDYYQTQVFSDYLDSLNKDTQYLIYCRTGKRSDLTLTLMKTKGFKNVSDLAGGYVAWTAANLPTILP
jgi:rhodanese-related sulfurtransferase